MLLVMQEEEYYMDPQEIIANFKIDIASSKATVISYLKVFLQKLVPQEADVMVKKFVETYEKSLRLHEKEDQTDLARYYRLIMEFKPTLAGILLSGKDIDLICDTIVQQFNIILDRMRRQINEGKPQRKSLGANGLQKPPSRQLQYYCSVCKQVFPIPPEMQAKLLNSDEKLPLPKHHDKEMILKISDPEEASISETESGQKMKIEIYPAELLMQHVNSTESNAEYLNLLSVGIDVGTSTTHLVFSRLSLKRERSLFNMSNRFVLVNREVIYQGRIIFTPLLDVNTIDIEGVIKFCEEEYKRANISPEQVDTGAVIVTGETAKKKNAALIVQRLSSESGKFVSASAGPNFESVLAAMGSGMVDLSRRKQNTILNVDVGGGSSKLAIISKGNILSTSSINIGGRLMGIDEDLSIWRIDEPCEVVLQGLGMKYRVGDTIPEKDVKLIAREQAKTLLEVMRGPATSPLAQQLMMTHDLDFSLPIDEISFSGGISEMIYEIRILNQQGQLKAPDKHSAIPYEDMGWYLADEIVKLMDETKTPLIEPTHKIRATVIGAGAFSLSVSGSTCYHDPSIPLPIDNVPVVKITMNFREMLVGGEKELQRFKEVVAQALNNFNLIEGEDKFVLYFNDITIRANLDVFSKALESIYPNSIKNKKLIIIILGFDGAKMLGLTLKRETSIQENLFCLDELNLEDGDWIDIGPPLRESQAFPITIKSLVFDQPHPTQEEQERLKSEKVSAVQNETADLETQPLATPQLQKRENADSQTSGTVLDREKIAMEFKHFQAEHEGYEILLILSKEGRLEYITDESFCSPEEARDIYKAWQGHESAFLIGKKRFPILSWADLQFAARTMSDKSIIVGTKTKSNRYVLMNVVPGTEWKPNVASFAVKEVHRWSWDLV